MPREGSHRAPYNPWVQHERQKKYNQTQRTLTKYRRFKRYEARQTGQDPRPEGNSTHALLELGAEAYEADFERRLSISFGGVPGAAAAEKAAKKAAEKAAKAAAAEEAAGAGSEKRGATKAAKAAAVKEAAGAGSEKHSAEKAAKAAAAEEAAGAGSEKHGDTSGGCSTPAVAKKRKKKRRQEGGDAADAPAGGEGAGGEAAPIKKKAKKAKRTDEQAAPDDAEAVPDSKPAKKAKPKKGAQKAGRFSKALKEYWRAEEEKEREWQRRQDEIVERHRKHREYKKQRALKGETLARRTASGQPRMGDKLEALTSKLLQKSKDAEGK